MSSFRQFIFTVTGTHKHTGEKKAFDIVSTWFGGAVEIARSKHKEYVFSY